MAKLSDEDIALGLQLEEEHKWALDVVCGMEVDPETTPYRVRYETSDYYFCNENCKMHFINNPTQYVG